MKQCIYAPAGLTLCLAAGVAAASDGFDWVTIGDPGNRAYDREDPHNFTVGTGSVGYTYRMTRTEVTSAQYLDFLNAAFDDGLPTSELAYLVPDISAIQLDPTYHGPGHRFRLNAAIPNADRVAVFGVSWFAGATFANWLHNDRPDTYAEMRTGAYDASTWSFSRPTGAGPRLEGARYWIPSSDEWIKAVYYDPKKDGAGNGGWWLQPNGSDTPLVAGLPGTPGAQTSAGLANDPDVWDDAYFIPAGSYTDTASPWGVLDASGGGNDLTDTLWRTGAEFVIRGTDYFMPPGQFDSAWAVGTVDPIWPGFSALRVATVVPSPGSTVIMQVVLIASIRRRRGT